MTDSLLNEALRLKSELEQARQAPTAVDLQAEAKRMRAERDESALRQTAVGAQGSTPDTTARALGLSRQTGLPVPVVERNMSEVERRAEFDRLGRVAEDPNMAAFVTDPTNYRLARDDFDTLQAVSDVARSLPAGAVKGLGSAAAGLGSAIDAGARQIDRGVRSLFGDSAANLFWFDGFNPATGLMQGGDFLKDVGAGVGVPAERQNLATDISEGVGQLGQQLAMMIMTGGVAGTTMLFSQGVDQQRERQDRQGVYGRDATTDAALFAGGAVTALTERYGLDFLMRKLPDPVRAGIMGKIRDVMLSAGNEAAQEVVEGILQNVVEYAFYNPDAEILQDFSREAMAAGGAAAVVRSLILAAVGGKGAARHQQAATQATQDAEALKQINTLAEQSNLRQRSPEKFAEFVRGLVEQDRSVEIDARTAAVLFQDQPDLGQFMTPDEVARLTREVALAQETGADVRMPLATFVGAFSGHAKFDELADNVRVSEDAPTAREAAEWSPEELERQVNMLRDDIASAVGQQNATQVIFDDMFRQLKAAAVDDAAATRYAAIVAARVRTRAERLGVDAVEMYSDQRPAVRRQLSGRQDVDMLDLALDDLRSKVKISDRAAYGPSMLETIADRGGVIDPGGEFKAAERWHRGAPGRKKLVRAAGPENADMLDGSGFTARYQVDSVARAMQEAGYIDENVPPEQLVEKFMDLFAQEMDGRPVYSLQNRDEGRAGRLERRAMLDEQLSALGLDPNRVTAAEVREAQERWAAEQVGMPAERKRTIMDQPAWHGSPHVFDRFSLDAIGTGEGAQAYGWGLYFAGRKEIAEYYREKLTPQPGVEAGRFASRLQYKTEVFEQVTSKHPDLAREDVARMADNYSRLFWSRAENKVTRGDVMMNAWLDDKIGFEQRMVDSPTYKSSPVGLYVLQEMKALPLPDWVEAKGRLYKVEIPEDNEYLLWDKPLKEQPELVARMFDAARDGSEMRNSIGDESVMQIVQDMDDGTDPDLTGKDFYDKIAYAFDENQEKASRYLASIGIAGIKYLDGSSRAAGDGSFNYVVFDDSRVEIKEFQQSRPEQTRNLVVVHNIKPDGVLNAARLGGLPVPSLAVANKDIGFDSFGTISLIADPSMVDPKANKAAKVFDADVYSPRYPSVDYVVNYREFRKVQEQTADLEKRLDVGEVSMNDLESKGVRAIRESAIWKATFLSERGIAIEPVIENGRKSRWGTEKAISGAIEPLQAEFSNWADQQAAALVSKERIFDGFTNAGNRKYLPHNLDTVVKILKRGLRAGESFNYGVGTIRSNYAKQFRSLKAIQDKRESIVTPEAMKAVKDELSNDFTALADLLRGNYKFDGGSFRYMDDLAQVLGEIATRGRTPLNEAFENLSAEQNQAIADFLGKLRDAPTEYFEAKVQRAVGLNEFVGAIVPKDVNPRVVETLKAAGLRVVEYDGTEDRKAKLSEFERQFFQREGNTPRGSIQFLPSGRSIITLTGKADLSTFLHEMSHGWLEEMKADAGRTDAPADIRADWERIARYLEIDPEVAEIPVEAHERFARTGEAYFMEGKAPSVDLASAFERFKAWLVRIYRSIRDLNVPINDEIRGVFDRMLATDAEIAQAQEQFKFVGMFMAAKDAGMTDQEFERYQNLAAKARMDAEQQVLARLQREAARRDGDEYREAREAIVNEVEAQMRAEPVYAAIRLMQDGTLPDGKAAGRSYKMDRKLLKAAYGEGVVKRLPRNVTVKGGVPPEMVAPMFGFTSADEMVQAMVNAAPFNAEVQSRTDRIMRERFPDPTKDGTAHEEAVQAMHGDAQMLVLEAEFKALKKLGAGKMVAAAVRREMAGKAAPSVGDVRAVRADQQESEALRMGPGAGAEGRAQVATERLAADATAGEAKAARRDQAKARKVAVDSLRVDRKALEKAAEQVVAESTVGDLLNTNKWRRAEKAAADAVVDAVAARDYASAAWHQRQRIINAYLVRQSANVRAEVEKAIERFTKYQGRKAPKSIDPDYLQQARTILDAYQFGPQLSERKRTILELRAINDWIKALDENEKAQLEIPPDILAADEKTHYRDMKVGEFMGLRDSVENLVTMGRNKNRLLREAKERDLNRVAALVGETISQNMKERADADKIEKGPGYRARQFVDGFFASHRKLEFLAREMDGFADLGTVWTALFKPLQDAQNVETRMSLEAHDAMGKLFERFPEDARKTWRTKPVYYPEIEQSLTKATVMALALNWGNDGNREAIRKGYKWNDAQVKAVLDRTLTERDWQFVQEAWDYVDSFWPQLSGLEKRVKGVEPQKVEAVPVETPFGVLRGGYYPLKYDADRSERAYSHSVDKMAQQLMSGFVAKASTRAGAAIERVGSGGMPVRLEMDVLFEHVAELIHDISHREAVLDVNRLLDHPEIKGAVLNTVGPQYHRAMKQQVRDIAAGDVPALSWMDKTINHLRGGMSIAAMGWKLTTALVQVTGFLQSVPRVGVGPMVKHVGSFYGNPLAMKAKTDWAFSKSVELRTRANTYDRDIRDEMRKIEGNSTSAQVKRSFFYLTAMMDMGVAVPVWSAAYEQGMEKFKGDEAMAIDYADQMVRTTQSSGLMKDLAGVQRGGPTQKMFTMFYSYFSATYNNLVDEMKRLKRPTDMPRFVANMAFLTFLPAVLSELMMGRGPDDGEDDEEGWAKWMAATTLKYSLSGFVGVRDIVSALGTNFGYAGSPVGSAVEAVVTLGKEIGQGEADRGLVKAAFRAAGPVLHLPTGQAWITAEGIYLWAEGYDITPFEMFVTRDPNKFR
jgi:hypothetical protein